VAEVGRRGRRRRDGETSGSIVLDASAILAVLYGEAGEEEIRRRIRGVRALVSTVNLSEVAAKLAEGGFDEREVREAVGVLGLQVHPLDEDAAYLAGMLRPRTRKRGMGVADRICVAVAREIDATAITTDGSWEGLEGVEVIAR
jgi:ribonuclease VapC